MTLYVTIVNLNCEPLKQGLKIYMVFFIKYILYIYLKNPASTLFFPLYSYCTKSGSIMLNVIGTDFYKCRSQCVLVKQFLFIYLLLRFAYSGVLLMTAFLKYISYS